MIQNAVISSLRHKNHWFSELFSGCTFIGRVGIVHVFHIIMRKRFRVTYILKLIASFFSINQLIINRNDV